MHPKIVLYFTQDGEGEYKVLRSLTSAKEYLLNKDLWPVFIDLSFSPMIASKVFESLNLQPKLPYFSQSLALAVSTRDVSVFKDRFTEIQSCKAYPILTFMGQPVVTEEEVMVHDLKLQEVFKDNSQTVFDNELLDMRLNDFEFSVRLTNVLDRAQLLTIGDVLSFSEKEFFNLKNCGRKSVNELKSFLVDKGLNFNQQHGVASKNTIFKDIDINTCEIISTKPKMQNNLYENDSNTYQPKINNKYVWSNIFENLLSSLDRIDERQQDVLKKRLGVGEKRKTLEEIGNLYGVTRERIRQIESKAVKALLHPSKGWNSENVWGIALNLAFETCMSPLSAHNLAILDDRFDFQDYDEEALSHLLRHPVCDGIVCFLIDFDGQNYFARSNQSEFDLTKNGIAALLPEMEGWAIKDVEMAVRGVIPSEFSEFFGILLSGALENSEIEEVNGVPVLKFYSSRLTLTAIAKSFFDKLDTPISTQKCENLLLEFHPGIELRSFMAAAQNLTNVFPFEHGKWGTIAMLGFTNAELQQIKTLATDFLSQLLKDQFHTNEFMDFLKIHNTFYYVKLDIWKSSGLLKYLEIGHPLGRNVFSKSNNGSSRILIKDLIVQIIRDEKKPIKLNDLTNKVKLVRSVTAGLNITQIPEVVSLGRGYYALSSWEIEITESGVFYKIDNNSEKNYLDFVNHKSESVKQWTESEILTLLELHNKGFGGPTISKKMGLTLYAVYSGLRKYASNINEGSKISASCTAPGEIVQNELPLSWTDERVVILKKMWGDGHSAASIAKMLGGGATRNSVIGKVNRLGLKKSDLNPPENDNSTLDTVWTQSQIRQLETLQELNYGTEVIAKILGKSVEELKKAK